MKSSIANTPQGPVEYILKGSGPLVFLCHGVSSNCFSAGLREPFVQAGFSLLTPSRPGFGRTPLDVGRSAVEAARAFSSLVDILGINSFAVLAISGGGPTGLALAASFPDRVTYLILAEAVSQPEDRPNEASYNDQMSFYGPSHNLTWGMLGLMARLSPGSMARQTMSIMSTHDPDDAVSKLSPEDIKTISNFYKGKSSRQGALNDATHTVGVETLQKILAPTLVVHSREDKSVPFSHAEWSLKNIPQAELCESGLTGHFFWVGPDAARINSRMVEFLNQVN